MIINLGILGYAYLEKGDLGEAIPVLEQAVQEAIRYRSPQVQSWFKIFLGEAYRANQQMDQARDLTTQGLAQAREIEHWWGVGLAQRTLGRIAQDTGETAGAAIHLQDALATFSSIHSQFELARTYLALAALAHTQDSRELATTHLSTAYAWFKKLQVPKWVERTEQLAREYGVTLTEVELADLTEEPS